MSLFPKRLYVPNTKFCVWRWTFNHHNHDQPVTRLMLLRTPWVSFCLHWLLGPDPDVFLHDHNMAFLSIVLYGGYLENRRGKLRWVRWFNFFRAAQGDCHYLIQTLPHTLTFLVMGPQVRESGVHLPTGWVSMKKFQRQKHKIVQ